MSLSSEFPPGEGLPPASGSTLDRTACARPDLDSPINLKNHGLDFLLEGLGRLGIPEKQVRQIHGRVVAHGLPLAGLRGLSKARLALLEAATCLPRLECMEREISAADGFARYLFRTHDGHLVEAVRIPLHQPRYSVCISSQVGCALGCVFCATGKLGFQRNLEPWEMLDQVLQVRSEADRPVTGVVFMGQGEPFLNYDNVIETARILHEPTGGRISAEAITISTAGILPNIRRYTAERHPYRLIVSLSAGSTETRRKIMPIEKKYPLDALIPAIRDHALATRTRVTLAWVAMSGVNTDRAELEALRQRIVGIPVRFNLIEVNDPSGRYVAPVGEDFRRFVDALQTLQVPIVRRYTGGKDIEAACGRLASRRMADGPVTSETASMPV